MPSTALASANDAGLEGAVFARAQCKRSRRLVGMAGSLGLGLLTASCLQSSVEKKIAFAEADHTTWIAKGTSRIDGEGFIRRPNAWLARCSGGFVYLVPATPYFREWVEVYRSGARLANAKELHSEHSTAIRKTQCDMQGRFLFADLPAGKWILVTRVTYNGQAWSDDSTLVTEVETRTGEVAKTILSNPNRI